MVRVLDDLEVGELIGSLRLSFGRLPCCRIQTSPDAAKGHRTQVAQAVTHGCGALRGSRSLLWDRRSLCGGIPDLREAELNDLVAERPDVNLPVRHHRLGVLAEDPQLAGLAGKKMLQLAVRGRRRVVCNERAGNDLGVCVPEHRVRAPDMPVPGLIPFEETTRRPPGIPGSLPDATCVP